MKTYFLSITLVCIGLFAKAQTPTADQIIDKYLAAVGGKEAIAKIQDLVISSGSETQRGTMETETKIKMPSKFTSATYMMGNEVRKIVCDGSKASEQSGFMGNAQSRVLEGNEVVGQIMGSVPFPEMLYEQYKIQKSVVGQDTVDGKMAWKVELAIPEGRKWTESFDKETGLKLKRAMIMDPNRAGGRGGMGGQGMPQGQGQPSGGGGQQGQGGQGRMGMGGGGGNTIFSDYKEIKDGNGVKMPFVRQQGFGQMNMTITISSIKVNKGLKDSAFEVKP